VEFAWSRRSVAVERAVTEGGDVELPRLAIDVGGVSNA
jgi:hypothetical protein